MDYYQMVNGLVSNDNVVRARKEDWYPGQHIFYKKSEDGQGRIMMTHGGRATPYTATEEDLNSFDWEIELNSGTVIP